MFRLGVRRLLQAALRNIQKQAPLVACLLPRSGRVDVRRLGAIDPDFQELLFCAVFFVGRVFLSHLLTVHPLRALSHPSTVKGDLPWPETFSDPLKDLANSCMV